MVALWFKIRLLLVGFSFFIALEKYNAVKLVVHVKHESLEIEGWLILVVQPYTTAFNNITVSSNCLSAVDCGDIMFTRK